MFISFIVEHSFSGWLNVAGCHGDMNVVCCHGDWVSYLNDVRIDLFCMKLIFCGIKWITAINKFPL